MKKLVVLVCVVGVALCESWGEQRASLNKNQATVDATQSGTRNGGNFKADAGNRAAITANKDGRNFKTGLVGEEAQAGEGNQQNQNWAKRLPGDNFEALGRGQTVKLNTQGDNQAVGEAPGQRGGTETVRTKYQGTSAEALIPTKGEKYNAQFNKATNDFDVKDRRGTELAKGKVVQAGRDSYNIPIQEGSNTVVANSEKVGRNTEAKATVRGGRNNGQYFSKTSDGSVSKTEIGAGNFLTGSAYTELDSRAHEARMGGNLVRGPVVKLTDRGQKDRDCPRPKNGDYEWNNGGYKIDADNVKLRPPNTQESGGNMNVKWPDCVSLDVPMRFPPGTKIEDLAVSLKVVLPGCNQVMCAGYICGNPATASLGTAEETCWEDDLCKYNPPAGKADASLIGNLLQNSKNDACSKGYNGGPITITFTFCAMNDARTNPDKHCTVANLFELFSDNNVDRSQIMVITTVYEKKNKGGSSGGFLGQVSSFLNGGITKVLTQCNKADYDAKGCHELSQDYQMNAFGISQDTHSYLKTGINRAGGSGASSGSSGTSGNSDPQQPQPANNFFNRNTPPPATATTRNIFNSFFGNRNANTNTNTNTNTRPWWQGKK